MPADHVSRNPNDTYYIDTETVLRCHTSAHQAETLRKGKRAFLVTGMPLALNRCLYLVSRHHMLQSLYSIVWHDGSSPVKGAAQATCTGGTLLTSLTTLCSTRWKVSLQASPSPCRKWPLPYIHELTLTSITGRHCASGNVGVKVLDPEQYSDAASGLRVAEKELKDTLEGLAEHLFGQGIEASFLTMPPNLQKQFQHDTYYTCVCGSRP